MATNEFKFSLHLLNKSSQPLQNTIRMSMNAGVKHMYVPDQATFILIVDEIECVVGPNFLHLFDILLECHLVEKILACITVK